MEGSGRHLILGTILDLPGGIEGNHEVRTRDFPNSECCSIDGRHPSVLVLVGLLVAEGWD